MKFTILTILFLSVLSKPMAWAQNLDTCTTIYFDQFFFKLSASVDSLPDIEGLYRVPMMDSKKEIFYRYDPPSDDSLSKKIYPDDRFLVIRADRKTRKVIGYQYWFHFEQEANQEAVLKQIKYLSAYYPLLKNIDSNKIQTTTWKDNCKNYTAYFDTDDGHFDLIIRIF